METSRGGHEAVTIALEGRTTVSSAGKTAARLLEAFDNASSVTIDLAGLLQADMSLIQLLFAATRTSEATSIPLTYVGGLEVLRATACDSQDIEELLGLTGGRETHTRGATRRKHDE